MAVAGDPESRLDACGNRSRVLRAPVVRYADLEAGRALDHRKWRQRLDRALESSRASRVEDASRAIAWLGSELLTVTSLLSSTYGTPDLGNKQDPIDELVYIILSRRTREGAYQAAFDALKQRYATWEGLAAAPAGEIESAISFSGLGRRKARSLKLALGALIERFGECTLEPTREWDDAAVRELLCTLPEIGAKSAACVMMCSLDRPAFPVDAHVGRVLERLGLFRRVAIDLEGRDHKVKQRLLWDAVPPSLRYPLHVNMLVHGRLVCLPHRPRCGVCVIAQHCEYATMTARSGDAESSRIGK